MACGGNGLLSETEGFSCFISMSNESDSVAAGCFIVLQIALELSFRN